MRTGFICGLLLFGGLPSVSGLAARPAHAAPNRQQLKVSLFGQPCLLQGPVDEKTLKVIHSLSPEQLYPSQEGALSAAPSRKTLEKLKAVTGAPAGLDRYRERLTKRLEAQIAFLSAVENLRKDQKAAPLIAVVKANTSSRRAKEFEAAVKKAEASKSLAKSETLDALFDSYNEGIESDPEEEFHRAIQRMGVQYACSFEEHGDGDGAANAAAPGESAE